LSLALASGAGAVLALSAGFSSVPFLVSPEPQATIAVHKAAKTTNFFIETKI
jgi:hypothetical protein